MTHYLPRYFFFYLIWLHTFRQTLPLKKCFWWAAFFFAYSSCNQTALSGDTRAKARDVTPNVSYLRLRAHGRGGGRVGGGAREKRSSLLSADTGASATKAEHEMSQIKKTQSFTATEGKNTTPQPHHDIAFWSWLDRGKMHIHEVSNVWSQTK